MVRKEFYLGNLGFLKDGTAEPSSKQTKYQKKCVSVYRKLLVSTFLYAAKILPHVDTKSADGSESVRAAIVRRFCTMVRP